MKREKRRYLALQLEIEGLPPEREILDAVWLSLTSLYGEVGASLSGLSLIDFDVERKIFVVRVLLVSLPAIRASIAAVTTIAGKAAALHILAVSGTLRALYASLE